MCEKKLRKICRGLFPALLLAFLLSGCGKASEEKLAEAETALAALADARTHADEVYDALWDDGLFVRLTEADKQADDLAETEIAAMTDDEIDGAFLPAVQELTETFAGLQELLDQTAEAEEAERREREGKKQITFHILNRSGASYEALVWTQGTGSASQELMTLQGPLADKEALAGVTVMVSEEAQTLWLDGLQTGQTASGREAESAAENNAEKEVSAVGQRYEVGTTDRLHPESLFYLVLLPDGQVELTTDPAALSEKPAKTGEATAAAAASATE